LPIFRKFNVKTVVRLSKKTYDHKRFTEKGVKFCDLYFVDGTTPTEELLDKFIDLAEKDNDGAIAVHCKAGLGRTGTLLACYIMKHYRFTAYEALAWCRLCRPGSVVGPQQEFLKEQEARMWRAGAAFQQRQAAQILPMSASASQDALAPAGAEDGLNPENIQVPIQPRKTRRQAGLDSVSSFDGEGDIDGSIVSSLLPELLHDLGHLEVSMRQDSAVLSPIKDLKLAGPKIDLPVERKAKGIQISQNCKSEPRSQGPVTRSMAVRLPIVELASSVSVEKDGTR